MSQLWLRVMQDKALSLLAAVPVENASSQCSATHYLKMVMRAARASGVLALAPLLCGVVLSLSDYDRQRNHALLTERTQRPGGFGNHVVLTPQELVVDKLLLRDKRRAMEAARVQGAEFPINFLTSRRAMESTEVFNIIRKMPKAACPHAPDRDVERRCDESEESSGPVSGLKPAGFLVLMWAASPTFLSQKLVSVHGTEIMPSKSVCDQHKTVTERWTRDCKWNLTSQLRAQHGNAEFDKILHQYFSPVAPDSSKTHQDVEVTRKTLEDDLRKIFSIITYRPVWQDFLRQALSELLLDNVQSVGKAVQAARNIYQQHQDLVAGFDLHGPEDSFEPLSQFVDQLLAPGASLPFFFHAGETMWLESDADYNLVDALLLGSRRIGHGLTLPKHPTLMEMVHDQGIAVEVCPISNQLLMPLKDPRNHPAVTFLVNNIPVVIGSDYPSYWGALPLTHDLYLTFMAMLGQDTGLAALKQLALNSLNRFSLPHTLVTFSHLSPVQLHMVDTSLLHPEVKLWTPYRKPGRRMTLNTDITQRIL
ncbi:adenosine deaminase AGSA-like [Babylonia areolata]|uniref:adenosine deaminase AGSA-like n=1 Tax=Babylonia areolata TaxID=304850 RepID=UPI003FCF4A05